MDGLEQARAAINEADREMAKLFARRMEAVRQVSAYKQAHGLPVLDASRERAVVENNAALYPDGETKAYYIDFLQDVMDLSKRYQHRLLEGFSVAYSGVEGAFADIAASRIFPEAKRVGYGDFAAAYRSVQCGECDCAVLPVENSYAGVVGQVMDLMFEGDLFVNGIYSLPVTQNLLALPGASLSGIQTVVSHPQALAQCGAYIRAHGYKTESAENTALADAFQR